MNDGSFLFQKFAGNPEVAELLMKNCAGLDMRNKKDEQTPLHVAAKRGNL